MLFIEKTTAQEWEQVGFWNPYVGPVFELFSDSIANQLYIGCRCDSIQHSFTNIARFDGHNFESLKVGINDCWNLGCEGLFTIGRFQNEIYASLIRSIDPTNSGLTGIGRWNGQTWNAMGEGVETSINQPFVVPAVIHDFHVWNDTLYMAGWFLHVNNQPATGVAAWDGENWLTFPKFPSTDPEALASSVAMYKSELYVGGNLFLEIDGVKSYDITKFDGTNWKLVGNGLKGALANLYDMEVFKNKLYLAGHFEDQYGNPGNCIASWDGEKWDDLGGGAKNSKGYAWINKMVVQNGRLWVVGLFDEIGGIAANNVASWDGQTWCSVGNSTFDRDPKGIAVWNDTVYVGGGFDTIGGFVVRRLAKFIGDPANNICGTVATKNEANQSETLQISPNPATEALRLTLPAGFENGQLTVFNPLGQPVFQQKLENLPEPALVIDIGGLVPGAYFVQIRRGDGQAVGGFFVKN